MFILSNDSTELVEADVRSISDILGVANLKIVYIVIDFNLFP
jgi:hypothetical protein